MLSTKLREVLDERGIKQEWLARKAGIHPTSMSQLVNGKRFPTLEVAFRIASALDIRVDELWHWEDKND